MRVIRLIRNSRAQSGRDRFMGMTSFGIRQPDGRCQERAIGKPGKREGKGRGPSGFNTQAEVFVEAKTPSAGGGRGFSPVAESGELTAGETGGRPLAVQEAWAGRRRRPRSRPPLSSVSRLVEASGM